MLGSPFSLNLEFLKILSIAYAAGPINAKYNPKIITPSLNENQLIIEFPIKGNNLVSFRSKSIHHFTNIETENILDYKIYINNILTTNDFKINKYDRVTIKIIKESRSILSKIILK